MKNLKLVLLFGVLVWLLPFAVGFMIFPLQESMPALFDSIMSVLVAVAAALLGYDYVRKIESATAADGLKAGLWWMIICIVIDLPIFVMGFKMSPTDYAADIGTTYAMIPVITMMLGKAMQRSGVG